MPTIRTSEAPANRALILDEGVERAPQAVRAIIAFSPETRSERSANASFITDVLATLPEGARLDITFRSREQGGPPAVTLGLTSSISPVAAGHLLDQLIAELLPDVRTDAGAASGDPFPFRRRLLPLAVDLSGTTSESVRLVASPVQEPDMPLVADPARRRLDVASALRMLVSQGQAELRFRIEVVSVDARMKRGLGHVRQRLNARGVRGPARDEMADGVWSLVGAMTGEGVGLRIGVDVGLAGPPSALTLDLLSLALFGVRADHGEAETDRLDLRCVWPATGEFPALVPSARTMARLVTDAPGDLAPADSGSLRLGFNAGDRPVMLTARDRARHLYVIGATGAGKSTLLLNLLEQDFRHGEGVILLDPHGDLADEARAIVPADRQKDLVFADAADPNGQFALNILSGHGEDAAQRRNYVANSLIRLFSHVLYEGVPEAFGPMFETYFRNALLLLMEAEGDGASLMDFDSIFLDANARRQMLTRCHDPKVAEFWRKLVTGVTHDEISLNNIAPYITCKLAQITGNPVMRRILCRGEGSLDLRRAMDEGRIIILKASGGLIGRSDTELLAAITITQIAQAAMSRATLAPSARRPVRVYIDEFQVCAGQGLSDLLAEARKFGVSLVLANQSLSQVDGGGRRPDTGGAALANAANLVAFRVGAPDAVRLAPWFAPDLDWPELIRLPDFHAVARVLDQGRPTLPQTLRMAPPPA